MSFADAIEAQPRNLEAAAQAFRGAIAELDLAALRRGTLVFAGIGASAHALAPAVLALRAAGRRAFAVQSTELARDGAGALGDAFVLVSQSGASAETVAALQRLDGAPVFAVSAQGESPLVRAARAWLPLGPLPDTRVSTLSYTATLQAVGMLCDALLGDRDAWVWDRIPELAAAVIADAGAELEQIAPAFAEVSSLDAIGGGPGLASAGETALLAREALRIPATGMETREYLHGPLEAVAPGFGAVIFGRRRERELAHTLTTFGATVALIGDEGPATGAGVATITLPRVPMLAAPILQILPVQLLVDQVAARRGLTIGELRRHQADTKIA
jgi:glucosamine--fructose-6-phosphate aminotransferase (isomerizing)